MEFRRVLFRSDHNEPALAVRKPGSAGATLRHNPQALPRLLDCRLGRPGRHPAMRPLNLRCCRSARLATKLRDRKSVVSGKSVSVRVALGGGRIIKKKKK